MTSATRRVLIVDPSATQAQVLAMILEDLDGDPQTAADFDEARSHMDAGDFKLLLVSESLAREQGADACLDLLASATGNPVFLITGSSPEADDAFVADCGADGHICKQGDPDDVVESIRQFLVRESDSDAPSGREPLQILLAEDSRTNQLLATELLAGAGHVVVVANNGLEAVEFREHHHFDLILMDVQMPEMDGVSATRAIRERESGSRVPIIALTAHHVEDDEARLRQAGMDGCIEKPISLASLYAALDGIDQSAPHVAPRVSDHSSRQAPSDSESGSVVDWDGALESTGGDRELLREIIEAALEECPEYASRLEVAVEQNDRTEMRRNAHLVKGVTRVFRPRAVSEAAETIELADDGVSHAALLEQMQHLRAALDTVYDELRNFNP